MGITASNPQHFYDLTNSVGLVMKDFEIYSVNNNLTGSELVDEIVKYSNSIFKKMGETYIGAGFIDRRIKWSGLGYVNLYGHDDCVKILRKVTNE
jgi:hypothetical protein